MQNDYTSPAVADGDEGGLGSDPMAILRLLLSKWYWFVASALLFLSIGAIYLYFAPRVYQKQTTILIKEEQGGSAAAFQDLSGLKGLSVDNTANETQVLLSRTLMQETVSRLDAYITYFVSDGLRTRELYAQTPFHVRPLHGQSLLPGKLRVTPVSDTSFEYQVGESAPLTAAFGDTLSLPFGEVMVVRSTYPLETYLQSPVTVHIGSIQGTATEFSLDLSILSIPKTSILNLSMQASNPDKASDVLNMLVEVYNEAAVDDKNTMIDHTAAFIAERLEIVRDELGDVDGRIEAYKRKTLSSDALSESSMYINSAYNLEEQQAQLDIQVNLINILADFMADHGNGRELLPFNIGLDNPSLNNQIQLYNENLIRLNRMLTASSDRNPVVVELTASLESMRNSISKTVADMEQLLAMKQNELAARSIKTTGRIEESSSHERQMQSIARDQQIKAELYLYLLNKLEENAILRSMTEENARVLDRAYGSDAPIRPQGLIVMLGLLILGLALPAAIFIAQDLLYAKVRGRSDVEAIVKAPLIGEIPKKPAKMANAYVVTGQGKNTPLSESFRILRTNLQFLLPANATGGHVLSITSTVAGEGKSYLSVNIAQTLALSGKRVILVGVDLRRPTLHTYLGLSTTQRGVSDFLAGQVSDWRSLVQTADSLPGVDLFLAGTIPPNPAELLMHEAFDRLITELREKYDYILLDQPPVHVVSDTLIANRVADVTLYTIRANYLNRRELASIQALYQEKRVRNMAVMLSDVDYTRLYYSVGYGGYSKGYYGEYGYDSKK